MEGFSLATTTLLQRHANEGESISEAIRDCLDYGKNLKKTESGKYISSYRPEFNYSTLKSYCQNSKSRLGIHKIRV